MRLRAIFCCVWFSLMPWQVYEASCHYCGMTYYQHLKLNLDSLLTWVTFRETQEDIMFEKETNTSWSSLKLINWGLVKKEV